MGLLDDIDKFRTTMKKLGLLNVEFIYFLDIYHRQSKSSFQNITLFRTIGFDEKEVTKYMMSKYNMEQKHLEKIITNCSYLNIMDTEHYKMIKKLIKEG